MEYFLLFGLAAIFVISATSSSTAAISSIKTNKLLPAMNRASIRVRWREHNAAMGVAGALLRLADGRCYHAQPPVMARNPLVYEQHSRAQ